MFRLGEHAKPPECQRAGTTLPAVSRDEYLTHLGVLPLFASCSRKDLQKIARVSDQISVEQGRTLVEEGTFGHEAYLIVDGTAKVTRKGADVAELGPGDHFGELALFDGGPRTATVTATSPMELLVLGQRELAGVVDDVPGLAGRLLASLAGRIRTLDEKAYG